jgi:hypothetical protein
LRLALALSTSTRSSSALSFFFVSLRNNFRVFATTVRLSYAYALPEYLSFPRLVTKVFRDPIPSSLTAYVGIASGEKGKGNEREEKEKGKEEEKENEKEREKGKEKEKEKRDDKKEKSMSPIMSGETISPQPHSAPAHSTRNTHYSSPSPSTRPAFPLSALVDALLLVVFSLLRVVFFLPVCVLYLVLFLYFVLRLSCGLVVHVLLPRHIVPLGREVSFFVRMQVCDVIM